MPAVPREVYGNLIPLSALWYCDVHAKQVADSEGPEYIVDCPNCGCKFGVN